MKPIISVLIFFVFCFCLPAPHKAVCNASGEATFFLKGKVVKTFHVPGWISFSIHGYRRFDFDGKPFEADSVSVRIIKDTLQAY